MARSAQTQDNRYGWAAPGRARLRARLGRHVRGMALLAFVTAAACSPITRNHGYVPSDDDLSQIAVGLDTRESVADTIGTPSSAGVVGESGYYYVAQRVQQRGPRAPEVISREIVAISFDTQGTVSNIERYGLEDGNVVAFSRRVTDSNVGGTSFLRQLLGNIGQIDTSNLGGN